MPVDPARLPRAAAPAPRATRATRATRAPRRAGARIVAAALLALGALAAAALLSLTATLSLAAVGGMGSVGVAAWARAAPADGATTPRACVGGAQTSIGRSLVIGPSLWVCGTASAIGGGVTVLGRVSGNVTAVGGAVVVGGEVDGDVAAIGGDVHLLAGARVAGSVTAVGGSIIRAHGAQVAGAVRRDDALGFAPMRPPWPARWSALGAPPAGLGALVVFWGLAGACLGCFFPRQLGRIERIALRRWGASLAVGLVTLLAGILGTVVLAITCLGLPLALLLALTIGLFWVAGTVALGYALGRRLLGVAREPGSRLGALVAATLGAVLIALAEAIPCLGAIIGLLTGCVGLGAALLSLSRRR